MGEVRAGPDRPAGAGFDRPIARLAAPRQEQLARLEAATALERRLVADLLEEMELTTRLFLLALRIRVASSLMTAASAVMAIVLTERPLLRVADARGGGAPAGVSRPS